MPTVFFILFSCPYSRQRWHCPTTFAFLGFSIKMGMREHRLHLEDGVVSLDWVA